jgi:hypothetical protein
MIEGFASPSSRTAVNAATSPMSPIWQLRCLCLCTPGSRRADADCSAAERVLGWRAQIDLPTGLADLSASMAAGAGTDADKSVKG